MLRNPIALLAGALLLAPALVRGDAPHSPDPLLKVPPKVPLRAYAFPLTDVRLLDGPFKHAQELNRQYLLSLDVDRLLHNFRANAGLPSSAKSYGGWEDSKCELRGHFVGHYLSGCALTYAATGDAQLKANARAVVAGLAECQAALKSGYLSAFPETLIDRVEAAKPVWAPWYTLHKLLAGLIDMNLYCGDAQALEVAKKFADWASDREGKLTDEQMQVMLGNEHGGMNDALANLYALTGEDKYLKLSLRFNHHAVLDPAARGEDRLTGLHANTQIPKFIGNARQFELTGDPALAAAARFFWATVVHERSYVIGGDSDGEHFTPIERFSQALGPNTTETCNTYNMLKLTRHLFCWDAQCEQADYYERALYNHILASQNPQTGMMCYYVPLRPGSKKSFNTAEDSFWCCTGTGVENHAKYGDSIYFHDGGNGLFVNLFIASELDWKAQGVRVRQETRFPDEAATRIVFTCAKPVELSVSIRQPYWATQGLTLALNDQPLTVVAEPGKGYTTIKRTWQTGDRIDLKLPMALHVEAFRDNPKRLAFLYGPLVFAAEVEAGKPAPVLVTDLDQVRAALKEVEAQPARDAAGSAAPPRVPAFTGSPELFRSVAGPTKPLTFIPFFRMYDKTYSVYFDVLSGEDWVKQEAIYQAELAREQALASRTVDLVRIHDDASERGHKLKGQKHSAGEFGNRNYRHATDGGWFSYELKVQADKPLELRVTYWGGDAGRTFDVFVDDTKLATQKLEGKHPNQFFDQTYALPADLLEGKTKVTVKFAAAPGSYAGGVFGVRIMRTK